jgi:hypothetical protein
MQHIQQSHVFITIQAYEKMHYQEKNNIEILNNQVIKWM